MLKDILEITFTTLNVSTISTTYVAVMFPMTATDSEHDEKHKGLLVMQIDRMNMLPADRSGKWTTSTMRDMFPTSYRSPGI